MPRIRVWRWIEHRLGRMTMQINDGVLTTQGNSGREHQAVMSAI